MGGYIKPPTFILPHPPEDGSVRFLADKGGGECARRGPKSGDGMNRARLYTALAVGLVGTVALGILNRLPLSAGWWAGVAIGVFNFSSLLSSVERTRKAAAQGAPSITAKLRNSFFVRYGALALAFFLVLQLGRRQFGSALMGFLSFYVITFLDYVLRVRKKGREVRGGAS